MRLFTNASPKLPLFKRKNRLQFLFGNCCTRGLEAWEPTAFVYSEFTDDGGLCTQLLQESEDGSEAATSLLQTSQAGCI